MTRENVPGEHRILGMVLALTLLVALGVAAYVLVGWGSECRTNRGCPAGQQCMTWTLPGDSTLNRFRLYRTCELPCGFRGKCPAEYECRIVDHGPGPGPVCFKMRPR